MPLTEFVRYLNQQNPYIAADYANASSLNADKGRVFVNFANFRLDSSFGVIVDVATGHTFGHLAGLRAASIKSGREVLPDAVFVLPSDDAEFIYLDRLVRTLHTLNYLTTFNEAARGSLLLKVHPRHVQSVAEGHGLAFEDILRTCGLFPEQIILELDISNPEHADHLQVAVANYRSRGFGIAVGGLKHSRHELPLIGRLEPTIVHLDALQLILPEVRGFAEKVCQLGSRLLVEESTFLKLLGADFVANCLVVQHGV